MKLQRAAVAVALVFAFAGTAVAGDMPESGFRADMIAQMKMIQDKVVSLAGEMPDAKYTWRPAEGVRSTAEVFVHTAAANYFLLSVTGVAVPEGINPRTMEQDVTKKEDILKALNDSYAYLYEQVGKMSDDDLEKVVKFFGQDVTVRMALMIAIEHSSEHLGQAIAYARMNGVVPPWSQKSE